MMITRSRTEHPRPSFYRFEPVASQRTVLKAHRPCPVVGQVNAAPDPSSCSLYRTTGIDLPDEQRGIALLRAMREATTFAVVTNRGVGEAFPSANRMVRAVFSMQRRVDIKARQNVRVE